MIVKTQLERIIGTPLCQELTGAEEQETVWRDDVTGAAVATCAPQQVINLVINDRQMNDSEGEN